jgi:hypothetical protein
MIYELRSYTPHEGKAEAMRKRFLDHVVATFFPRHGVDLVGVLAPVDGNDGRIFYITRFDSEKDRVKAWDLLNGDSDWLSIKKDTEADGPLIADKSLEIISPVAAGLLLG